jgi:hypothetical protein
MRELAIEWVGTVLTLLVEAGAFIVLAAIGIVSERAGVAELQSGIDPLTVWLLGFGALALFRSVYLLGDRRLAPRLLAAVIGNQARTAQAPVPSTDASDHVSHRPFIPIARQGRPADITAKRPTKRVLELG